MKTKKMLLEWAKWDLSNLTGVEWDDVANEKNPPPYARWQAAQLPYPNEKKHGPLGACQIIQGKARGMFSGGSYANYLKEYYINGYYADGTVFDQGPIPRAVAAEYLNLHRLSVNNKEWDKLKATNFHGIKTLNGEYPIHNKVRVIKLQDGFWLKDYDSQFRVGPFTSKQIARTYALVQKWEFAKSEREPQEEIVDHINYPTFLFTYKMRNIPCADIVVAEDQSSAMKLFDLQWHIADNTRPIKTKFNSLTDLAQSLRFIGVKDIKIAQIRTSDELEAAIERVEADKNLDTNPRLKTYIRNSRFRYILGRDMKTGRSPVTITW